MHFKFVLADKHFCTIPERAYPGDSGMDLHSVENVTISPKSIACVDNGLILMISNNKLFNIANWVLSKLFNFRIVVEAQIRPKSGLALKKWISIQNTPGTIDSGYVGNIKVILRNDGDLPFTVNIGDKVAQIVFCPVIIPNEIGISDKISKTDRGSNGFGSTGYK